MITAIDLFCGAGGLTHGLQQSGIDVTAGVDADGSCNYPYEFNNDSVFICDDIANVTGEQLLPYYPEHGFKLLAGCAPCQPFSTYTHGRDNTKDKKWGLLNHFSRLVNEIEPELVTMENVTSLEKKDLFSDFVAELIRKNYSVAHGVIDCRYYGVPQRRKRLVLVASKLGKIELPLKTHSKECFVTVQDVIRELEPIGAGKVSKNDPLHRTSGLTEINMKRMKASKPGGTWRDWPEELIAPCHKKDSGKTYPGVYGRMEWNKPAPTMTTQCFGFGNGRFGHPEQDRAISLREAAMFQTFPQEYQFVHPEKQIHTATIGRLIGNAVPVRLAQVIGEHFLQHVRSE